MKRFLFFLLIAITNFIIPTKALAITNPVDQPNNRVGVHIFSPNEIDNIGKLINSNGGSWGYVTVPLRSDDRDREKWQEFMHKCAEYKIIPIIRLATTMTTNGWSKPTDWDHVDFANFLSDLDWPTKNRYVIVYNEPNHATEWGGTIDPTSYAFELDKTIDTFKDRNEDFYMLPAGLDAAAPTDKEHMKWRTFLFQMNLVKPGIFTKLDGWNSHSYPNYAFSGSPYDKHDHSIISYRWELDYLKNFTGKNLSVFITETGWSNKALTDETIASYWQTAFFKVWTEENIIAITPFTFQAGGEPFSYFSLLDAAGNPKPQYNAILNIRKNQGQPEYPANTPKPVLGAKLENTPKPQLFFNPETKAKLERTWKRVWKWFDN